MSDDGKGYIYYNRITGQSRLDLPPSATGFTHGAGRRPPSPNSGQRSVEDQQRSVQDWEKKTRIALTNLLRQTKPPTMAMLIDNVNDSLREVFEAVVSGSAAEEEMSRAHDMGSESGMAAAAMREEAAREALGEAHTNTLALLRELLVAFGYVGPLDKMDDLPRPNWATDVTLIGSIGLLSSNVHAAVRSRIVHEEGMTVWSEVMRSATRLKDVVSDLPHRMAIMDTTEGKNLFAFLGIDSFDMLSGRWGFSSTLPPNELRELDQEIVLEVQRIKSESEAVVRTGETLNIIRVGSKLHYILGQVDIASVIDIDGEIGNTYAHGGGRARAEDLELYNDLVHRARQNLHDLDTAYMTLTTHCVNLLSNSNTIPLTLAVERCYHSISTLLMVSREQNALLSQSQITGSLGHRSTTYRLRRAQRPQSMASQVSMASRTSRASRLSDLEEIRRKAKSMEQEYEEEERGQEQARQRVMAASASQSQTSLRQSISGHGHSQSRHGHGHRTNPSASASTSSTSLGFKETDSDGGSQKAGNRSSFMRFMRGRSSEDDGIGGEPLFPGLPWFFHLLVGMLTYRPPYQTQQEVGQTPRRRFIRTYAYQ
jgi:son of sevenless-like protein